MKRAASVTAAGLLVVVAVGTGAAVAGSRQGAITVTGSARNAYPTAAGPGYSILTVSVRSDRSGQNPRGTVSARGTTGAPVMGDFAVSGAVTCVRVSGHRVAIKYRFDTASGSAAALRGGGVEVFIQDNGRPRDGHPVDANAFDPPQPAGVFDATAGQCDDPNGAPYSPVQSGDYTLRMNTGRQRHAGQHIRSRAG